MMEADLKYVTVGEANKIAEAIGKDPVLYAKLKKKKMKAHSNDHHKGKQYYRANLP